MMDISQQFKDNWKHKRFAAEGQKILLAVSGGVDSMVMAHLFRQAGISIAVAHCNFQLRGAEANKDEELVSKWCKDHEVPFYNIRFDTKKYVEEWKKGIQETARILRYEWLDTIRQQTGCARIATAHHADDNAETFLINLLKGTGIRGLHGIPPINGLIIRPLLFAAKEDIRAFATAHDIPYREDASNATDAYLRNAVRHHVIPLLDEHFPGVVGRLNESIYRFSDAELLYNKAIEQERKKLLNKRGNDIYIPIKKLRQRTPLETICYELFQAYGFTSAQVPHIIALFESESGHYIESTTHKLIHDRDFLIVTTIPTHSADHIVIEGAPCVIETPEYKLHFSVEKKPAVISPDANIAYIDMRRIVFPIRLRRWRRGDYFYPLGMNMKKKKLSNFFIDQKVPLHEKERIWVLESDKRIGWIAGMRLDERFKITDATEKVLKIELVRH